MNNRAKDAIEAFRCMTMHDCSASVAAFAWLFILLSYSFSFLFLHMDHLVQEGTKGQMEIIYVTKQI